MPEDAFAALVARVGAFHVTDRAMKNAQLNAEEALRNGTIDERARAGYLDAVRKYFAPFEREARTHLRDVDRRLEHANQVVFNLTAERGVAVKRIEATQGVLADLAALEHKV
jgi:enoyl-CoA hydratase/carnithine racemase